MSLTAYFDGYFSDEFTQFVSSSLNGQGTDYCNWMMAERPSNHVITQIDRRGWTTLHFSANAGNSFLVNRRLFVGVNVLDSTGRTPLFMAALHNYTDIANLLLQRGARVDVCNENGRTPLHIASYSGSREVSEVLVRAGANINAQDNGGWTPLHHAVNNGCLEQARYLLRAGANMGLRDNEGKSTIDHLLMIANSYTTENTIREIFDLLVEAGTRISDITVCISPLVPFDVVRTIVPPDTPFGSAVNNDAPMLAAELAGGLDVNTQTPNGMTLMHWACAGDAPECVQHLLDAGASINIGSHTPIFYCIHESTDCLRHLIDARADVRVVDADGWGLLHYAAVNGNVNAANMLINAGADVNAANVNTHAPLHIAALNGHTEFVRLLISSGANVNAVDQFQRTPLHFAASNNHCDVARLLLRAGADPNAVTDLRFTPLHFAAQYNSFDMANVLLQAGARAADFDTYHQRASEFAPAGSPLQRLLTTRSPSSNTFSGLRLF